MQHLIKSIRQVYPTFKKIYVASVAPVIRRANRYGIDIPEDHKLLAYQKTVQEIANILGADQLIYQDLDEMERVLLLSLDLNDNLRPGQAPNLIAGFEDSIFRKHIP
jgi:glutamine phosphoribosylpyrophosphate amidotransferase